MATGRRRGRAIIYIALILILLLVLVYAVTRMNPLGRTATPSKTGADGTAPAAVAPTQVQDVENIVVTTQDLRRGQTISEDLLAIVAVPREQYTEGVFFKDMKEVAGARAKFDMKAHTPITSALIVAPGASGSILSFEMEPGKVAISIPVSKLSSISYGLQKGDRVNVLASLLLVDLDNNFQSRLPNRTGVMIAPGPIGETQTNVTAVLNSPPGYDVAAGNALSYVGRVEVDPSTNAPVFVIPGEAQRPRLVSQTLIQDVTVLQVGDFKEETVATQADPQAAATPLARPNAQAARDPEAEAPVLPDTVTLMVEPQDAVSLNYLMLSGASLNLVLRPAGDDSRIDTEAATLQFILDQYRIPNPAKLPYGTEPRIDMFPEAVQPFPVAPVPTPMGN
jgi:pilus assembly protein CpaB